MHWSSDNWSTITDRVCDATGLGTFVYDLPTQSLVAGDIVGFTILWTRQDRWEGADFAVAVGE